MESHTTKQIQDAAELFFCFRLQEELENLGKATSMCAPMIEDVFNQYLHNIGISIEDFKNALPYSENINKHVVSIAKEIGLYLGNNKADVVEMINEGRAQKKKSDFYLLINNGNRIPISLKNYKKESRIQTQSGTFKTFIINLLFDSNSIGNFEYNGQEFSTKNDNDVINSVRLLCKERSMCDVDLIDCLEYAINIDRQIREKYTESKYAEYWTPEIAKDWKKDCVEVGNTFKNKTLIALKNLPQYLLYERFIKMTGLSFDEEMLNLFPSHYMLSLTNKSFNMLRKRLAKKDKVTIEIVEGGKGIDFVAKDNSGSIIVVNVPFTLNKNGAWHNGKTERWSDKDQMFIQPKQRRPKKSRELSTSINTYILLKEAMKNNI